nr:FRIGIDA-like protein [Tanacetum cinerariifolium]
MLKKHQAAVMAKEEASFRRLQEKRDAVVARGVNRVGFNAIYKHLTRKSGESGAELVENAKTSYMERYGNKKFQYDHAYNILKNYPKWNAVEPIDEDNLNELFGHDPRAHPDGKQQAAKKQKSVDMSSAGGEHRKEHSGSSSGSSSSSSSGSSSGSDSGMYPGKSVVGEAATGSGCSSAGKTSSSTGIYSGYTGSGT